MPRAEKVLAAIANTVPELLVENNEIVTRR